MAHELIYEWPAWFFRRAVGLGAVGLNSSDPTEPDLEEESCRSTLISDMFLGANHSSYIDTVMPETRTQNQAEIDNGVTS